MCVFSLSHNTIAGDGPDCTRWHVCGWCSTFKKRESEYASASKMVSPVAATCPAMPEPNGSRVPSSPSLETAIQHSSD